MECKVTLSNHSTIDIKNDLIFKWFRYKIPEDPISYVSSLGNCSEETQEAQNWEEIVVVRKEGYYFTYVQY